MKFFEQSSFEFLLPGMQKIIPFLWFDGQAEEAANFYVSVFTGLGLDAKMGKIMRYGKAGELVPNPKPAEMALTVEFELQGQTFVALNGGPEFKFNEAVSFQISCEDQEEVDYFWEKLTLDGGQPGPCGWLKDKYGLSWQVTPEILSEMLQDPDAEKSTRVMEEMLKMGKIDIEELQRAYVG